MVARHTKSTSELGPGWRSVYDPSRLQPGSCHSPPGTVLGTVSGNRACSPRVVRKSHATSPPSATRLCTPQCVSGCRQPMNLQRSTSPELVRTTQQPASAAAPAGPSWCLRSVTREASYAPLAPASPRQASNRCHSNGDVQGRPLAMAAHGRTASGQQLAARQQDMPMNVGAAVPQEVAIEATPSTLLQHIQCVQQEISRLQAERQNQLLRQQDSFRAADRSRVSKQPVQPGLPEQAALVKLQRWWRRAKAARRRPNTLRPLRPVHFAAARIQRAWRIGNWRRKFVSVSVTQVGWLGSLTWLQEKNLLYGTELADAEDASWWAEQRQDAPLDHEVDPWGAMKLRDHLDRMWYGRTSEETAQEEQQRLLLQHQQQQQQHQQLLLQQGRQLRPSTEHLFSRKDQRAESLGQGRYSLSMQDMYDLQIAGRLRGKSPTHGSAMSLTSPVAMAPTRSTPLFSSRCGARASKEGMQRGISAALPKAAAKSASLSPRLEMRGARGEAPSRLGQCLQGAAPGVPAVRSFLSPPSTHRALGSSPVSQPGGARHQSPLASYRSAQLPVVSANAALSAAIPVLRAQCIVAANG